jgi:glycosyltransferase involved in cell wall biosynthesis
MLNYEFPPIGGGAAYAHLSLLKEYAGNSELVIDVLTSGPEPGFFEQKFSENVTIYKVGVHKKDLHFWRKAEVIEWLVKAKSHYRRLLRENDYDLVHAFFGFPTGWLCYRTAGKLPYVISLRGSDVPGEHARLKTDYKILSPVFKGIWKKAAALVACSEGLKRRALRFLPSVAIDVIPNGVDLERFGPAEAAQRGEVLKLLTVGRLSVTKRVEMLIEAVGILNKSDRKVHFSIVGGGAMEQELRQVVLKDDLGDIIELTGRIESEQMPRIYRQHDIFISSSMQEGMSNAMLEAMASGLPIIATDCEGLEELIADNGVVVDKADAESLAREIIGLADDEQRYQRTCAEAREKAETFSWENTASLYVEIYNRISEK